MLRGNFKRASFNASRYRNRNLDNLHVIPISSVVNNNPVQLQPDPVMQKVFPSVVPVPILPVTSTVFSSANNYQGKFNKKRKKRIRQRNKQRFANKTVLHNSSEYRWFNPNTTVKNNVADIPMENETEKLEVEPEAPPPPAEEHFEEVEVASNEGDGKRIPVGFRKTKLRYLNYKKKSFFKPKFYDFSSQRTVVNCLNVEDDVSVDVDVVSEAEYDGYETDPYDAVEKFGKIIEIEDEDEDEDETEEVEEENVYDVNNEMEESAHIITDETEESTQGISDEMDEEHTSADDNGMDKKSIVVTNEINEKSTCAIADKIKEKASDVINEVNKENLTESKEKKASASKTWINKADFEGNSDLIQAKSLIQNELNAWESHLIGLEYLLEICDKNKVLVLKYYCVLCNEEFDVQELSESYVINHVSGCKHITKYLEKHFPTCGFNLSENNSYDFIVYQKLCEKINENLGYYFLYTTNNDYYSENKLKIKETIENASHPSEADFKFEKCILEKDTDSDLSKNINNVIEDIIKKIIPENEITTAKPDKNAEDSKSKSDSKLTDPNLKKKPAPPKPKHKGNNSVSAFLRLTFAATNKLKLSDKEKIKKTKSNTEDTVENVKSDKEEIKENVKSQNQQQIKGNSNRHLIKPKNDEHIKSPISKSAIQKVQLKDERVIETITLDDDDDTPEDNTELKNEQLEEKESKEEAEDLENSTTDNSTTVKSQEVTPNVVKNVAAKKIFKNKEKVLLKTTIHSKHCRKINQVVFATRQIKVC